MENPVPTSFAGHLVRFDAQPGTNPTFISSCTSSSGLYTKLITELLHCSTPARWTTGPGVSIPIPRFTDNAYGSTFRECSVYSTFSCSGHELKLRDGKATCEFRFCTPTRRSPTGLAYPSGHSDSELQLDGKRWRRHLPSPLLILLGSRNCDCATDPTASAPTV